MEEKKMLPPAYFLVAIVLMAALNLFAPITKLIAFPWNLLGLVPLVCGIALNLVADGAFKKAGTTVKPFEGSNALVTTGVFRISRNPMYLGLVLIVAGIAALLGSLSPFLVVPVFAVLLDRRFMTAEERMLEETFGATWREYQKRVRRWI
jgi:protein-S-isoprenylcysteine O-methyltransferase Ste14